MKKSSIYVILFSIVIITFSSCATVFGGRVSECQRTKPAPGQPQRQVRPVPLIADILIGVIWLIPDFATGAIYKPCKKDK